MDEPINFTYKDSDSFQNEISELYSYSEESDFLTNRNAFEECMEDTGLPLTWKHMVPEQKSRAIGHLMTTLEVSCRTTRIKSCRALAYLVQGNFSECLSLEEQASNSQENVFLLYQQGLFQAFVQQLLIEADLIQQKHQMHQTNPVSLSQSQIFNDSAELRVILAVLCTTTETMYHAKDCSDFKIQDLRQQFIADLQCPFGDELLTVTLFQMLNTFCGGSAPHYPVRKIILLLWKIILITLGGTETLKEIKGQSRKKNNLEPVIDDTFEVTKNMRPCSPPLMPDGQVRTRTALSGSFVANKRKVFKQPAFDDAVFAYAKECLLNSLAELNQPDVENEPNEENNEYEDNNDSIEKQRWQDSLIENQDYNSEYLNSDAQPSESSSSAESGIEGDADASSSDEEKQSSSNKNESDIEAPQDPLDSLNVETKDTFESAPIDVPQRSTSSSLRPVEGNIPLDGSRSDVTTAYKGLPWSPKVRRADLDLHLANIRQKFLGYTLPRDLNTTFGFPTPIIEGISVLKKHLYVSLSDIQLDREELMEKFPLTYQELNPNYRDAPAEKLYTALLPRLPQYMIALLKVLLAASTNTKNKTERSESINLMSEINLDSTLSSSSIIQTMKANADANRHREVVIKAISAILLILLKHFKTNHIYQFEYVSQQLMFANCIPLILKFLSQDIYTYILAPKSTISAIDFPACVIGEQPELTTEAIELCSFQPYCWRNMFGCVNLLRVLNKLTKWKHSRIMMLVVFKSAPTLVKALSVRHSMFQLYVLKLLKVQLKFLGRQWKKTNMKLISAIYQKVRHRLTDDWAYSNDNEARPWDFQAEEFTLQADINKFHQRRYQELLFPNGSRNRSLPLFSQSERFNGFEDYIDEDYDSGTHSISQISPNFERDYEIWLESEVYQRRIDWDHLLGD